MREAEYIRGAELYLKHQDWEQVLRICDKGLTDFPQSLRLLELARLAAQHLGSTSQEDYYRGRHHYLSALSTDTGAAQLVWSYCLNGNLQGAREALDLALRQHPHSYAVAAGHLLYAAKANQPPSRVFPLQAYARAGDIAANHDLDAASVIWTWGVNAYPQNADLHNRLANFYTRCGDPERARLQLERLRVLNEQQLGRAKNASIQGAVAGGTSVAAAGATGATGAVAAGGMGAVGLSLTAAGGVATATGCGCIIGIPMMAMGLMITALGAVLGVITAGVTAVLALCGIGAASSAVKKGEIKSID